MILVDTSVWIEHLRNANTELARLLEAGAVLCHPFVVGEIACGTLRHRADVLDALGSLPQAPVASHDEAMTFLDRQAIAGRGIGWVDVHLLASTALAADARLWSFDKRLTAIATGLGIAR